MSCSHPLYSFLFYSIYSIPGTAFTNRYQMEPQYVLQGGVAPEESLEIGLIARLRVIHPNFTFRVQADLLSCTSVHRQSMILLLFLASATLKLFIGHDTSHRIAPPRHHRCALPTAEYFGHFQTILMYISVVNMHVGVCSRGQRPR